MKEELVELSDSEERGNPIAQKLENDEEHHTIPLSALIDEQRKRLQRPLDSTSMDFKLTDPNKKDEFRAIIKEMGLEWEKVDR